MFERVAGRVGARVLRFVLGGVGGVERWLVERVEVVGGFDGALIRCWVRGWVIWSYIRLVSSRTNIRMCWSFSFMCRQPAINHPDPADLTVTDRFFD